MNYFFLYYAIGLVAWSGLYIYLTTTTQGQEILSKLPVDDQATLDALEHSATAKFLSLFVMAFIWPVILLPAISNK